MQAEFWLLAFIYIRIYHAAGIYRMHIINEQGQFYVGFI